MSIVHFIITIFLFVILSPGILVRLPKKSSKWKVAIVHGVIFAIVMYIVYWYILPELEGFQEGLTTKKPRKTKAPAKMETKAPTKMETKAPTKMETKAPAKMETKAPSKMETKAPTKMETKK